MAKVIQITQYEANDGSMFTTEAAANAHDFMLENKAEIDRTAEMFCNSIQAIDRSRSGKTNTVSEFLAWYLPWIDAGKPGVERVAFDTPKETAVEVTAEAPAAPVVDAEAGAEMF